MDLRGWGGGEGYYINYCYYNLRHTTFCYCGVRVIISKTTFSTIRFLFLRTRIFHTITRRALEALNTWRTVPAMLGWRISSWSFSRLEENVKLNKVTGSSILRSIYLPEDVLREREITVPGHFQLKKNVNWTVTGFRPGSNAGNLLEPNLIRIKADVSYLDWLNWFRRRS